MYHDEREPVAVFALFCRPSRTLSALVRDGRGQGAAWFVAAAFGLLQAVPSFRGNPEGGFGILLVGAIVGVGSLALFGWLLRNFSRWFGAAATLQAAWTGLGLGLGPWLLLFALLVPLRAVDADPGAVSAWFPLFFGLFVYGFTVLLLSLSGALQLGVLKTFLCLVLTALVSIFPLTLMAQLFLGSPAGPAP